MKNWLKRLSILLAGALAVAGMTFWILIRLASQPPDFYPEKVKLDPVQAAQLSDRLLQKTTALASQIQHPGRWYEVFTEDEINAWLAVDFPKNHRDLLPPKMSDPRVKLQPDTIRLAVKADYGVLSGIVRVDLQVHLPESNTVVVIFRKVSLGALPLPVSPLVERLKQFASHAGWEIREMQKGGAPTFVLTIRPVADEKGHMRELTLLHIGEGRVELSGTVYHR